MDRLDAMVLFVSAVEDGSLAAAARTHGRSPAAVTRAVAYLERHAGEALLLRSTRKLSLTAAGERHVAIWRDVLARLREVEPGSAAGHLHGSIVLTAPELFGRLKVMPVLEAFLRQYPHVAARVLMDNRVVDLVGDGVDLAVRLAALPDSTMTAIRVGEVRAIVCASPDYVARSGLPATPHDLARHDCIGLNAEGDGELWSFDMAQGQGAPLRSTRVRTRLSINNAAAGIDASLRGHGIIRARCYQVAEHLETGRLVRLLSAFEVPPTPAQLVFHPDRARRGVLRAFIDHAVPTLRREFLRLAASMAPPLSR
ncbi:LysR family transcriptional regulator [Lichenihabitans sp. PAMC28606]|uniref:LysR family transcriptional regulator n=1 Tax=Lichenihabitans sp. PAMC28606 TaxID=2880932 RepID=UPI001D09C903|nr:LysR family transcriptional regulator [Lichenihabitans sp. PAMC28606]UDL93680.1 LysR family transcriptional regulator [Lichenihabitans sp. PAMC28606]